MAGTLRIFPRTSGAGRAPSWTAGARRQTVIRRRSPGRKASAISDQPRLRVEPFTTEGTAAGWMVRWRLRNDGQRPLRLVSALQPHARFHTDEVDIGPELPPGGTADLALPVRFSEPPGTV